MASAPIPANDELDNLCDIALEHSLLGLLLVDNAHVDRAADLLKPSDFADGFSRQVFEAILNAVGQGKAANPATLRGHVEHPALMFALTANPSMWLTPGDAAKQLADLADRRRMRDGLLDAARCCGDLTAKPSEIVELADSAVASKAASGIRQSTAGQCLADYIDGLDAEHHGVLCDQIPAFDDLHGPMEPSQLIILAARPGMGKTACALSYALGAAKAGRGVLFASLEMNGEQLAGRMASDLCYGPNAVPYAAIVKRKLNDFQRRRISDAWSELQSLPLNIIDAGALTPGRLAMLTRRHARKMAANGHKLELVIVDYLQLMRPDSGTNKPYEAVSEISRGLKALAKDQGVPVLALAQLSREVEKRPDKRPQLSDLRDSGQIEQDADSVMFLLRNEYYLQQIEPEPMHPDRAKWEHLMGEARGKIEFILAKRRNGTTGTAQGQFHGAFQAVR
jgi:replicative DNA helicase